MDRCASGERAAIRTAILVGFLVLGFVMAIIGIQEYNALNQTNYQPPASKFGLVIFTSPWTRMERNGQVEIKIYDIGTNTNTAGLNVVCTFDTNDTTPLSSFSVSNRHIISQH